MSARLLLVLGFGAVLGLGGCTESETEPEPPPPPQCLDADGIVPGLGASVAGVSFCLGETAEVLRAHLGAEGSSADLGAAGLRLSWSDPDLVATLFDDAVGALQLGADFAGTGPGAVGLGAEPEAVQAEFGEPVVEPFGQAWLYDDAGIGFQWLDGAVVRIQLYAPRGG